MHKYIIKILVPPAEGNDFTLLHEELQKEAFALQSPALQSISLFSIYRRKGDTIKDINDAVFRATRRTGKRYSFTIMKEKTVFK